MPPPLLVHFLRFSDPYIQAVPPPSRTSLPQTPPLPPLLQPIFLPPTLPPQTSELTPASSVLLQPAKPPSLTSHQAAYHTFPLGDYWQMLPLFSGTTLSLNLPQPISNPPLPLLPPPLPLISFQRPHHLPICTPLFSMVAHLLLAKQTTS